PDLPEVVANQQQIQQVFLNIIDNARYALNRKFEGKHKDKVFEISGAKAAGGGNLQVRIAFYDRGIGMSPDMLDKVVNPFFSTKPSGTGLGLSISHGIVADHGGRLFIESTEGEFTRVTVSLPARKYKERDNEQDTCG
ncbi:MAG TPA: ATP-binding protein, partial [Dissulfurispiraceae bacterium]